MIHRLATIIACLLLSSLAAAAERVPIAFVGSFVDIKDVECNSGEEIDEKTGETLEVICMDSVYEATYQVEKVLEGNLTPNAEVKFQTADHYGFPRFAEQRRALIYLSKYGDELWHVKYEWDEAYATADGDFAQCGCADLSGGDGDGSVVVAECRNIAFSPPVTVDLTHVSKHVVDELRTSLDYQIQRDRAVCIRGVLVEDLYKHKRAELIKRLNDDD